MQTKTITLYNYDELSEKAQQRALDNWNQNNDDPFMQSHMINLLKEELEEQGIEYDTDSIDVWYSLAHCQGDGFMFIGTLYFKGEQVDIEHGDHHYYHMYTARFTWPEFVGEEKEEAEEKLAGEFTEMYQEICKEMERIGYDHIEYITSEESFIEACEANGYTFREDGTMENV